MITFSIITCTYNASQYIGRTLESVRRQTYPHIEHLIIDGLSKDNTVAKAQAYAQEGGTRTVSIVSERDKGLYDAMNKGIRMASGDYIIFLNAGDKFANDNTLADIARQTEAHSPLPGVIYGDTDIVNDEGTFLHRRRLTPPEHLNWRSFRRGMLVCHQSFYARTDIAKHIMYDLNYRLSADVDWCIRIMKEAERQQLALHNSHLTLCAYLDGGMSVKNHRASLMERFRIMSHHYGLFSTIIMHQWFVMRGVFHALLSHFPPLRQAQ